MLCTLDGQMLEKVLRTDVEAEKTLLAIPDAKVRWYTLMKSHSPFFGNQSCGPQLHEDGSSAGFIYTGSVSRPAEAAAVVCLSLHSSHPIIEQKSWWQWLHENYVKAIVVGVVVALVAAMVKLFIG
jgi:hypothetical protein